MIQFEVEERSIEKEKKPAKQIDPEVIELFQKEIDKLKKGSNEIILRFTDKKDMTLARNALNQAGIQSKKYVRVRKERGTENSLVMQRISKQELDAADKKAKARGAKLKGKKRAKKKTAKKK